MTARDARAGVLQEEASDNAAAARARRWSTEQRPPAAAGHDQRQRLDVPEGVPGGRDRGVHEGEPGRQDQLRRRWLRQGPPGLRRHGRRLRGCADAPYKDADMAKIKGGDFLYFPVLLGAITRQLQRRRRRQAAAVARDDREDLPARHQEVERPGDRRRQPRREAARRPTSSSRTARTARARPRTSRSTSTARRAARGSSRAARRSSGRPTRRPATATAASRRS